MTTAKIFCVSTTSSTSISSPQAGESSSKRREARTLIRQRGADQFRRFLVFLTLAVSFGGFLFYAGVVVPAGTSVIGANTQGFVTQLVTRILNLSVLVTVLLLTWDIVVSLSHRSTAANRCLIVCTILIGLSCLTLIWLHQRLDSMLDAQKFAVLEDEAFYGLHRIYLWTSTIQWLCSLPVFWIFANTGIGSDPTE